MEKGKNKQKIIIELLVVLAIVLMTVGFAAYGQRINFNGTAIVRGNGKIYISSVTTGTLVNAAANPEFTDSSVDFNLSFTTSSQAGLDNYSATFNVTIVNDSVYDYVYSTPTYVHTINRQSNGGSIDPSYLAYSISGISSGDTIVAKSDVTFTITVTFTNPLIDSQYDTFIIDGDFTPTVTEQVVERLYATVDETTPGNLRGNNTSAAFSITVMSTYTTQKTFTISLDTNKFDIRDANMNTPAEYTINANDPGQTYTFYIVKKSGVDHYTDTERVGILIDTVGQNQFCAGRVTVLVDQTNYYADTNAPLISNVAAEITNTEGSAIVSWSGRDLEAYPTGYTVIIYRNNSELRRQQTQADETSMTLTGLSEGTYYFTVIGTDPAGNTATSSEISSATTSEGHASKSSNIELRWRYTISFNLTNCQSKQNATIVRGTDYTTTLQANNNYTLSEITVTLGGSPMDTNGYNFNSNNGSLTIYGNYITDNINVSGTATSNGCLAQGTKVLLSNGTYKNIEDIEYTDLLKVYNHVTGTTTDVYPIWIEKKGEADKYLRIEFSNGSILKIVNNHSLFDVDNKKYVDVTNEKEFGIGSRVYALKGNCLEVVTVINVEKIEEKVNYYNIVSTGYYNIFANDILTTDTTSSVSNVYGFRENAIYGNNYYCISNDKMALDYNNISSIPYYLYKGLNLKNAKILLNSEINVEFLNTFIGTRTLNTVIKNGKRYFSITTSEDNLEQKEKFLFEEGSSYFVPNNMASYYIETSTNKKYMPGEQIKVENSIHLEAVYEK